MVQEYDLGQVRGGQGPAGPAGPQGPQGPAGPAPQISVGNTLTLPPGSAATVSRRAGSPDSAPVFDFGIPQAGGDMAAQVYDPNNKHQDIFAYADSHSGRPPATIVVAAADSQAAEQADYQCSGSGDQQVLQAAINALPEGGGKIILLEGTYHLNCANISADEGVYRILQIAEPHITIEGMGSSTVLRLANEVSVSENKYYLLWIEAEHCRLSRLKIDGNSAGNSAGQVEGVRLHYLAANSVISDCLISGCNYCGVNNQADCVMIRDNHISGCGDGLRLEGAADACADNQLIDNDNYGLYANGGSHHIYNNYFSGNQLAGISCLATNYDLLTGNYLVDNPVGVELDTVTMSTLIYNTVFRQLNDTEYDDAAGECAMDFTGCVKLLVIFNRVKDSDIYTTDCTNVIQSFGGTHWNFTY